MDSFLKRLGVSALILLLPDAVAFGRGSSRVRKGRSSPEVGRRAGSDSKELGGAKTGVGQGDGTGNMVRQRLMAKISRSYWNLALGGFQRVLILGRCPVWALEVVAQSRHLVEVSAPIAALERLTQVDGVQFVRLPIKPKLHAVSQRGCGNALRRQFIQIGGLLDGV